MTTILMCHYLTGGREWVKELVHEIHTGYENVRSNDKDVSGGGRGEGR